MKINKIKIKILLSEAVVSILVSVYNPSIYVYADPLPTINQNTQIKQIQNNIETINRQMEITDSQIEGKMIDINNNTQKIDNLNKEILDHDNILKNENIALKDEIRKNENRLKNIYIEGNQTSYLDVLMNSKNLWDLINRTVILSKMVKYDNNVVNNCVQYNKEIQKEEKEIKKEKDKISKLRDDDTNNVITLNSKKDNQRKALLQLQDKQNSLTQLQQRVGQPVTASNNTTNVYKDSTSKGILLFGNDNVVDFAKNFLGVPYLWGGTSPNTGFDCSGFVQYVYAYFGVNLPRTSQEQVSAGEKIDTSIDSLKPGDLLFWGDSNAPHHVGIYIGNGQYIQAPHTGDVVKITQYTNCDAAVRILAK